jgi:hypothetical protein
MEMLSKGVRGLSRLPFKALRGLPRTLQFIEDNPALRILPGAFLLEHTLP